MMVLSTQSPAPHATPFTALLGEKSVTRSGHTQGEGTAQGVGHWGRAIGCSSVRAVGGSFPRDSSHQLVR